MALFLNIIQGPLTGDKYEIFEGLQLGRSKGHIRLDDTKASGLHAQVEVIKGNLVLVDKKSKNGLRQDGERVLSLKLEVGTQFQIGDSHFVVESDSPSPEVPQESAEESFDDATVATGFSANEDKTPVENIVSNDDMTGSVADELLESGEVEEITRFKTEQTQLPVETPEVERRTWTDRLEEWSEKVSEEIQEPPKPLTPFDQTLQLVFLKGLQAETTWTLGYGPRKAGPTSMDLPIHEPGAPDPCFEIYPTPQGAQFKTGFPNQVLLNGRAITADKLKQGDKITILESVIEVDFLK